MHISGNDWSIDMDTLAEIDPGLAIDWPITFGGSADSYVEYIYSQYDITCDPAQAITYLLPYGAWEEHELADHDENMLKLIWIIGCDLGEQGEAYLSAY